MIYLLQLKMAMLLEAMMTIAYYAHTTIRLPKDYDNNDDNDDNDNSEQ